MKRKYFLITNTSGWKYWSYLGTLDNTDEYYRDAIKKHGEIYINELGGWFHPASIKEVHEIREQVEWPREEEIQ